MAKNQSNRRSQRSAKPGQWTGVSQNFSFEEAFKNALDQAPRDLPTDFYKYVVVETGYEEGGFVLVQQLYVTIKQVFPNGKTNTQPTLASGALVKDNCTRKYANMTRAKIDKMIAELVAAGADVTGDNPWMVDTHQYDVKLRGTFDPATSELTINVIDKKFFVTCAQVWDRIHIPLSVVSNLDSKNFK